MGNVEFRVFFNSDEKELNRYEKMENVEKRTDVYILIPELPEFGLKLRSLEKIELKTRIENKNNKEFWKKEISKNVKFNEITPKTMEKVVQIVQGQKNLSEILENKIKEEELYVGVVHKRRLYEKFEDCVFECEYYNIFKPQEKKKRIFKTICYEDPILEIPKDIRSLQCMGYNEYLSLNLEK